MIGPFWKKRDMWYAFCNWAAMHTCNANRFPVATHQHTVHHTEHILHIMVQILLSKGKVGYPRESTRDIYQHIPPIYALYNGFMGQYGVMFWEQLLGYVSKGTPNFPWISSIRPGLRQTVDELFEIEALGGNLGGDLEARFLGRNTVTLPETNSKFAPENRPGPKRKRESIPTIHFQMRKC